MTVEEYKRYSDTMLLMWMDEILTDGEYSRIMDKLDEYAHKCGIHDRTKRYSLAKGGQR